MQRLEDTSTPVQVAMAVVGYSLCSSTLLLANKLALNFIPLPCVVTVVQLIFSIVLVFGIKGYGVVVDDLEWSKIKPYLVYIFVFSISLYSNMHALKLSNVETVIVFRACSPILVTIIEYMSMGRTWPSIRSCASLVCIYIIYIH